MNKYCMKDAKDIQNTCFKLNSLQLRALLGGYLCASNEPRIPRVSAPWGIAVCGTTTVRSHENASIVTAGPDRRCGGRRERHGRQRDSE